MWESESDWWPRCLPFFLLFITAAASAAPFCSQTNDGWCVYRRIAGTDPNGELGFRFGEPLDFDGDGHADIAGGARFKLQLKHLQNGSATVWSGTTGTPIRSWDGEWPDGLFGHWVMPLPDISGDRLADVVIAAPHAGEAGAFGRGILIARSPRTDTEIWRRVETDSENLGWDLALAGDQNHDGYADLFVGAPAADSSRVYLLSGKNGAVLHTYALPRDGTTFGWYVARLDDLDGDDAPDLAVGAPSAPDEHGDPVGGAWILSTANGRELHHWKGQDRRGGFGGVVASVADFDGDHKGDLAVAAPATEDQARTLAGEVFVYSSSSGAELRHWPGRQPGELYGRMIVSTGDLDGDGIDDLAISAPAFRRDTSDRVGRVELRSGRSGEILTELFGDEADCWFGWHIRRAPDPEGKSRPALLIGSLRHPVDGKRGVGVLDLYVFLKSRHPPARADRPHGMNKRGTRRNDIK